MRLNRMTCTSPHLGGDKESRAFLCYWLLCFCHPGGRVVTFPTVPEGTITTAESLTRSRDDVASCKQRQIICTVHCIY